MNCRMFEDNISLYLDGELKDIDKKEFELHLLKCVDCRQKYENMINIIKLLKKENEVELPKDYHNILMGRITNIEIEKKKRFTNWRAWISAAAILIIFISFGLILNNNNLTKDEAIIESQMNQLDIENSELLDEDIAENSDNKASKNEQFIPTYNLASEKNMNISFNDNKTASRSSRGMVYKRKLVKSEHMDIVASQYDDIVDKITDQIQKTGGYVESLTINYGTDEKGEKNLYPKNGSMKLRVTEDKFEETIRFIKNISDVEKQRYIENDITETYFENENIINSLRFQEDRLVDMMEQTKSVDEIIDLEKELGKIRIDIEKNSSVLRNLDSTIYMPTINLNLREAIDKEKDLILPLIIVGGGIILIILFAKSLK